MAITNYVADNNLRHKLLLNQSTSCSLRFRRRRAPPLSRRRRKDPSLVGVFTVCIQYYSRIMRSFLFDFSSKWVCIPRPLLSYLLKPCFVVISLPATGAAESRRLERWWCTGTHVSLLHPIIGRSLLMLCQSKIVTK